MQDDVFTHITYLKPNETSSDLCYKALSCICSLVSLSNFLHRLIFTAFSTTARMTSPLVY